MIYYQFTTGVEKNNDDAKKNYFSSNKHDSCGDILWTEARLEVLSRGSPDTPSCSREKRQYKRISSYWDEGGILAVRSKNPHQEER